jgi:hypothetical protein
VNVGRRLSPTAGGSSDWLVNTRDPTPEVARE